MYQKLISRDIIFCWRFERPLTKREGSGSVGQRYRTADPNLYQNITNPEHRKYHLSVRAFPHARDPLHQLAKKRAGFQSQRMSNLN